MSATVTAPWIVDASRLARMGLKGPAAADWLARARIGVPEQANSWALLESGDGSSSWNLLARLGWSEFFLEEDASSPRLRWLSNELATGQPHVYPVLREDRAFVLGGRGAEQVLAQMCNVNFSGLPLDANPVVLTLMIGVAVVVVPQREREGCRYRIWCDPSFGRYLWGTLEEIVAAAGGGRVGIEQLRDGPRLPGIQSQG